jgi:hypothetical protein
MFIVEYRAPVRFRVMVMVRAKVRDSVRNMFRPRPCQGQDRARVRAMFNVRVIFRIKSRVRFQVRVNATVRVMVRISVNVGIILGPELWVMWRLGLVLGVRLDLDIG